MPGPGGVDQSPRWSAPPSAASAVRQPTRSVHTRCLLFDFGPVEYDDLISNDNLCPKRCEITYIMGHHMSDLKGTVGKLWRRKEHGSRALGRAWSRDLQMRKGEAVKFSHLKTACKKLFSVTSSVFLRFAGPAGAGRRRRRAEQDQWRHVV